MVVTVLFVLNVIVVMAIAGDEACPIHVDGRHTHRENFAEYGAERYGSNEPMPIQQSDDR